MLCSEEMCHNVWISKKTPDCCCANPCMKRERKDNRKVGNRMCNCTDVRGGAIAKGNDRRERTVAEYPELLYRLKEYDSYYDCRCRRNMLSGPNEDEILDEATNWKRTRGA